MLGWFENGFRHISNRVRPVRTPADLKGHRRIRVLPSKIQARTFELLGANPKIMDLTEAIALITSNGDRRAGKPADQHGHLRRSQIPPLSHAQQPLLHFAADLPAPADVRCLARRPQGRDAARDRRRRWRSSATCTSRRKRTSRRAIEARGLRDRRTGRRAARGVRGGGAADLRGGPAIAGRRAVQADRNRLTGRFVAPTCGWP